MPQTVESINHAKAANIPVVVAINKMDVTGANPERIKQQLRVEDFFPSAIESGGNGRWKLARCPFHDDHNPSFWIDTKQQLCGCHSGCTPLPLDVIGLYARLHGIDNTAAIKEMARHLY